MVMRKLTQEQFIKKARAVHGDRYDYSKSIYTYYKNKIIIICPIHGEFNQKVSNHLNGSEGCPKCSSILNTKRQLLPKNYILNKAKEIHDDRYNYSKVEYKGNKSKVIIICPEHGEFQQRFQDHLSGNGCKKCASNKLHLDRKFTTNYFIEKAIEVHGNKYNYNDVDYINKRTKVCIICIKHGKFWQKPSDHIYNKQGCPRCNRSKGEKALELIFKKYNIKYEDEYKIPDEKYLFEYDFYLPHLNILIEFHGKQHYEWIPYFQETYQDFEEQRMRDKNKILLAKLKGIPLIELNYKQFKELTKEQFETLVLNKINQFK